MYGPTGAGKSYTMFGSSKEPGIAYRALQNILGENYESSGRLDKKDGVESPDNAAKPIHVIVTILEIYNEELFDLLAASNNSTGHWIRPNLLRARLEIMGKKAKNAVSITGTDAEKLSREIAKVEKRRVIKSTSCNERSSRSHCLVFLEVPSLGGRLVLVDMAGSENIEQAGVGVDMKMQTGKINQGNIALKRVVEAIANGDPYIPFRDSKLTMLLQDSFQDDKSKILMILCASPDPKDMHKTIGTLEYGCKAKCIVALPTSPTKEKLCGHDGTDLEARVLAMNAQISKLEAENHCREKERDEMYKELKLKEEELAALQQTLEQMEHDVKEKHYVCNEDLRVEMEIRIKECQRAAEEFAAAEKKKLEERVAEQQTEIDCMRSRMKEIERDVELFLRTLPMFSRALSNLTSGDGGDIIDKVRSMLEFVNVSNKEDHSNEGVLSAQLKDTSEAHDEFADANDSETDLLASQDQGLSDSDTQYIQLHNGSTSEHYSKTSQKGAPCATAQECYEQSGWLPMIQEEPEGVSFSQLKDTSKVHDKFGKVNDEETFALPNEGQGLSDSDARYTQMCNGSTSELYSKTSQEGGPYVTAQECSEQSGWLPMIPEESEGEEEMRNDGIRQYQTSESTSLHAFPAIQEGPCASSMAHHEAHLDKDFNVKDIGVISEITPLGLKNAKETDGTHPSLSSSSRRTRIENIFMLCGNYRELAAVAKCHKQPPEHHIGGITHANHVSEHLLIPSDQETSSFPVASTPSSKASLSPITPREMPDKINLGDREVSPVHFLLVKGRHCFAKNTVSQEMPTVPAISTVPKLHHSESTITTPVPEVDSVSVVASIPVTAETSPARGMPDKITSRDRDMNPDHFLVVKERYSISENTESLGTSPLPAISTLPNLHHSESTITTRVPVVDSISSVPSVPATAENPPVTSRETSDKITSRHENMNSVHSLVKLRRPFSENTPPYGMPPGPALSTFSIPHHSKSAAITPVTRVDSISSETKVPDGGGNSPSLAAHSESWDVYVKWETSKDSAGKLISIVKMERDSTLADLRTELQNHGLDVKMGYTFLLLRDPSGNPVEKADEYSLSLKCLPDCHKQGGTKLACLRLHLNHTAQTGNTQAPLRSLENHMVWSSPMHQKVASAAHSVQKPSPLHSVLSISPETDHLHEKTSQRLSFPLVFPVTGLRL
ncbi:hypothetical protein KP509_17G002000 [Ceratopteris richardii]|nr:hypothetical protein KP509_17G002000 [Ceratopteris richardii]